MAFPLIILAFGSIFVGYIFKDMMIGVGTDFWGNALFYQFNSVHIIEAEFLSPFIKIIPIVFSFFGAFLAIYLNHFYQFSLYSFKVSPFGVKFYSFFSKKWYFDLIYNTFIVKNILDFGYHITFKSIDRGLIELVGPLGIVRSLKNLINKVSTVHSGYIYHYTFVIICGLILFIVLLTIGGFQFFIQVSCLSLVLVFCFLADIIVGEKLK
jgi:NADH-ubiquinone oxidoreductase chain 5